MAREIAALAARQHGVVSWPQLLAAGLSPSGISRRVRAGRLMRLHRGVWAVGHTAIGITDDGWTLCSHAVRRRS